jgi:hypothetical protein
VICASDALWIGRFTGYGFGSCALCIVLCGRAGLAPLGRSLEIRSFRRGVSATRSGTTVHKLGSARRRLKDGRIPARSLADVHVYADVASQPPTRPCATPFKNPRSLLGGSTCLQLRP